MKSEGTRISCSQFFPRVFFSRYARRTKRKRDNSWSIAHGTHGLWSLDLFSEHSHLITRYSQASPFWYLRHIFWCSCRWIRVFQQCPCQACWDWIKPLGSGIVHLPRVWIDRQGAVKYQHFNVNRKRLLLVSKYNIFQLCNIKLPFNLFWDKTLRPLFVCPNTT